MEFLPFLWIPVLIVLGVLFYMRAVASRKGLRCPQCGEYMRIELMDEDPAVQHVRCPDGLDRRYACSIVTTCWPSHVRS